MIALARPQSIAINGIVAIEKSVCLLPNPKRIGESIYFSGESKNRSAFSKCRR